RSVEHDAEQDFRFSAIRKAMRELSSNEPGRVQRILMHLSDPVVELMDTPDDYYQMALTGCVAMADPAFWSGYDHSSPEVFADYFDRLTDFEPKRAAKYGLRYYTWLAMNPKEAEDRGM